MKVKTAKPVIRPSSTRGGVADLAKTKGTILDYAKASPETPTTPNPAEIRVLSLKKGQR